MSPRTQTLPVSLPGIRASRVLSSAPYIGMKHSFVLTRFEAGQSEFWTHGKTWTGAPGTIVVFQPGDVHRELKREGPITYQILNFAAPEVDTLRVQSCFSATDPRAIPFRRLHDAVATNADAFTLECLLTESIDAMRALQSSERHAPTRPVRRALTLLRERFADQLTLDELAVHAGLDKFHLCRAFRAQVGMAPHAYLTQLRIVHARELLDSGTRPKDVAPQIGLYDQSQLNRHFRRIVGMTPGAYFAKNLQGERQAAR